MLGGKKCLAKRRTHCIGAGKDERNPEKRKLGGKGKLLNRYTPEKFTKLDQNQLVAEPLGRERGGEKFQRGTVQPWSFFVRDPQRRGADEPFCKINL